MRDMGRLVVSAVLVAGLAVVAPGAARADDAPMCDGKPATIVGPNDGFDIQGTSGDDVIVTNSADSTDAGEGDDTICVTSSPFDAGEPARVQAGPGSDTVDASQNLAISQVELGPVNPDGPPVRSDDVDTFLGGPITSHVVDPGGGTVDIDLGERGHGSVYSYGDDASATIDLGTGGEFIEDSAALARGPVHVDDGALGGEIALRSSGAGSAPAAWVLDDRTRTATRDGATVFTWDDFGFFSLGDVPGTARFVGGPAAETLEDGTGATSTMGGGNDTVYVGEGSAPVDGGPGRDRLEASGYDYAAGAESPYTHVDLRRGTVTFDPSVPTTRVTGFEDVDVLRVQPVAMVGDDGSNRLTFVGGSCDVSIDGRGGDDVVSSTYPEDAGCSHGSGVTLKGGAGQDRLSGTAGRDVLDGGSGNDRLVGLAGNDVLDGGPGGGDRADGGSGTDTCRAEVRTACER